MLVEVSETTTPFDTVHERRDPWRWSGLARATEIAVKQLRSIDGCDIGDAESASTDGRPLAACSCPTHSECRRTHNARNHVVVLLDRQERGKDRNPTDEVSRAVDRIDDQAMGIRTDSPTLFLPNHADFWTSIAHDGSRCFLDGAIRLRHRTSI